MEEHNHLLDEQEGSAGAKHSFPQRGVHRYRRDSYSDSAADIGSRPQNARLSTYRRKCTPCKQCSVIVAARGMNLIFI